MAYALIMAYLNVATHCFAGTAKRLRLLVVIISSRVYLS